MTEIKIGFMATLWGFKFLFHPRLRHYIYLPLIINALFFGIVFYFCWQYVIAKLSFLSGHALPNWLSWLNWIMGIIRMFFIIILFTFLMGVFTILATLGANLLALPFNGLLSEKCSLVLGITLKSKSLPVTLYQSLMRELRKLLYYLPRACLLGIICAVLYFIPLLNLTIPFLFYWFGAWIMAIQYLDYPADNHHVTFINFIKMLKAKKSLTLSFGLIVAILSSIPLINFIIMPCAVLGATKIWHDYFMRASPEAKMQPLQPQLQ